MDSWIKCSVILIVSSLSVADAVCVFASVATKMFADVSVFFGELCVCRQEFGLMFLYFIWMCVGVCAFVSLCVCVCVPWSVAIVLQFSFHLNIYGGTKCKLCAIIEFHEFLSLPEGYFSKLTDCPFLWIPFIGPNSFSSFLSPPFTFSLTLSLFHHFHLPPGHFRRVQNDTNVHIVTPNGKVLPLQL